MPRWPNHTDNAKKIFAEARVIARRLADGQVTVTALLKEYRCGYTVFRRGLMRALGEEAAEDLLNGTHQNWEARERQRIETEIAQLKDGSRLKTVWICRGCREEYQDQPEKCPSCSSTFFESGRVFVEEKDIERQPGCRQAGRREVVKTGSKKIQRERN